MLSTMLEVAKQSTISLNSTDTSMPAVMKEITRLKTSWR
jgi:hypothetical protein